MSNVQSCLPQAANIHIDSLTVQAITLYTLLAEFRRFAPVFSRQRRATAKEEHFLEWGPAQVEQLGEVDFRRGALARLSDGGKLDVRQRRAPATLL